MDAPELLTFKESGCSLIRAGRDVVIVDHGPLGMPHLYGHGHADALSLVLRRSGADVLIDPGTYTYTGDLGWRRYFRGTRAHNTITVDHQDQAVQETPFQWSRPYAAELVRSERRADGGIALLARHPGYQRLGVQHWRGVAYLPNRGWLVWDYLAGQGDHCLDLHWHVGIAPTPRPDGMVFLGLAPSLRLTVNGGDPKILQGQIEPISGWRSRWYGHKEPCTTIRVRFEGPLPHEFVTRLTSDDEPEPGSASAHDETVAEFRRWVGRRARTPNI